MKKSILAVLAVMLLAAACGKTETQPLDKKDVNNPYQPVVNHDPAKEEKIVDTKGNSIPGDGLVTFDTVTTVRILALPGSPVLVTDKYFTFLYGASDSKGAKKILELLDREKIQSIDYVILATSTDAEVSGAMALLNSKVRVANFGLMPGIQSARYEEMIDEMVKRMQMHEFERAGGKWMLNGCTFEVLYPMTPDIANNPKGEGTCIMRIEKDGVSAILTGQMDDLVEKRLLERNKIVPTTFVVITDGGAVGSLSGEFLEKTKPEKLFMGFGNSSVPDHQGISTQKVRESETASFILGKSKKDKSK